MVMGGELCMLEGCEWRKRIGVHPYCNKSLTCFHFLQVHRIGLGYLRDKSFLQFYPVVEGSSVGEFSSFWFIENFGILGILWGKLLFYFLGGLGQGRRECEFFGCEDGPFPALCEE